MIWDTRIPLKISAFLWRVLNALLPTDEILKKEGLQFRSRCQFCQAEETIDHIFFSCRVAATEWNHFEVIIQLTFGGANLNQYLNVWWLNPSSNTVAGSLCRLLPNFVYCKL
ncbi:hypothetical protein ACH5RR_001391 [Cinchona calisaya]|uniref:Reverse transcriptase zinc-binding domain-containing protein n=1 Tax=Cinchona calisaya TaxID=153742 RepID=A0ABD3B3U1_9GENT